MKKFNNYVISLPLAGRLFFNLTLVFPDITKFILLMLQSQKITKTSFLKGGSNDDHHIFLGANCIVSNTTDEFLAKA